MRTKLLSFFSFFTALLLVATSCAATPELTVFEPAMSFDEMLAEELAFEASPQFLSRARMRIAAVESMRFEVLTSMDSSFMTLGSEVNPMMTGEVSGNRARWNIDMSSMMGPLGGGLNSNNLRMSMIADGADVYMNAPFFAELATVAPELGSDPLIATLNTGWGRIDASEFFDVNLMDQYSAGTDATQLLAVLEATGATIEGSPVEVRGVPTRVIHANVTWLDLFAASGQDLGSIFDDDASEFLSEATTDIAVHLDDDALIRRIEYTMDLGLLAEVDSSMAGLDLTIWQRVDYYDFGAPVNIEIPPAVDVTDDFERLLDFANN